MTRYWQFLIIGAYVLIGLQAGTLFYMGQFQHAESGIITDIISTLKTLNATNRVTASILQKLTGGSEWKE